MAKLITEQDVRDGKVGDPIVIDADTRITPSALDRAAMLGIRVKYSDPGKPSEACHIARDAALPVVHLPDGQYLVHVNRGQTRVYRLTPGGPVPLDS
ncbi:MAG: hypothetical protein V2A76_13105 [Planctomycetota bacterium]